MRILATVTLLVFVGFAALALSAPSGKGAWVSDALGETVQYRLVQDIGAGESVTVIRLADTHQSPESQGPDPLLGSGYRLIELDYRRSARADFPYLAKDIHKLRSDILRNDLFEEFRIDPARIFILPESYGLLTDVLYFDDDTRPLFMDIAYPVYGDERVPCLLEFSCDNNERMGNFSLAVCRDTLLESFATQGYAFAMADHPMPPPYKGIDDMPECVLRAKSAVRTLRSVGSKHGLSGRIGAVGFSRGSGMTLALATTRDVPGLTGGRHQNLSSEIDAGIVLSGRFTYLDLFATDKMWPRYRKHWGDRKGNFDHWKKQGALDYLDTTTIPLLLSINSGEGPDAQHQMRVLRERLAALGSEYIYIEDSDGTGHKVPYDPNILKTMERYLESNL